MAQAYCSCQTARKISVKNSDNRRLIEKPMERTRHHATNSYVRSEEGRAVGNRPLPGASYGGVRFSAKALRPKPGREGIYRRYLEQSGIWDGGERRRFRLRRAGLPQPDFVFHYRSAAAIGDAICDRQKKRWLAATVFL